MMFISAGRRSAGCRRHGGVLVLSQLGPAAAEAAEAAKRKDKPPSAEGLWIINIIIGLLGGL